MGFHPGQRVTTLGFDGTVYAGTVVGKVLCHLVYAEKSGRPTEWHYHVRFDVPEPNDRNAVFECMEERDLKTIEEKWMPQCECGNMWRLCHPHA